MCKIRSLADRPSRNTGTSRSKKVLRRRAQKLPQRGFGTSAFGFVDILSALKGTEIPYRAVRLAFSGLPDGLLDGFLLLT